jgi:hypothetical protein
VTSVVEVAVEVAAAVAVVDDSRVSRKELSLVTVALPFDPFEDTYRRIHFTHLTRLKVVVAQTVQCQTV